MPNDKLTPAVDLIAAYEKQRKAFEQELVPNTVRVLEAALARVHNEGDTTCHMPDSYVETAKRLLTEGGYAFEVLPKQHPFTQSQISSDGALSQHSRRDNGKTTPIRINLRRSQADLDREANNYNGG